MLLFFAVNTVNIVDIVIPPIRVICIVLCIGTFHFAAYAVCVYDD